MENFKLLAVFCDCIGLFVSDLDGNPLKTGLLVSLHIKVKIMKSPSCLCCNVKYLSRRMGKPTICMGKNKGADQLRSNCEVDQHLCFRYLDTTVPLLLKSEISSY